MIGASLVNNQSISASVVQNQSVVAQMAQGSGADYVLAKIYTDEQVARLVDYATCVDTCDNWAEKRDFVPNLGQVIVYSDYLRDENGVPIAALKIGDGSAYLADLPFIAGQNLENVLMAHKSDTSCHVSESEREFWNNKTRVYVGADGNLVFTTGKEE